MQLEPAQYSGALILLNSGLCPACPAGIVAHLADIIHRSWVGSNLNLKIKLGSLLSLFLSCRKNKWLTSSDEQKVFHQEGFVCKRKSRCFILTAQQFAHRFPAATFAKI
jgi:hypothetical protein